MATQRFLFAFAAVTLLTACGGDSTVVDMGGTDTGSDTDLGVPAESCGQPGDTGNENGIGAFCSPGGRQCSSHPLASLCIVDVSPSDNQWYCTRLCSTDANCGSNAVCGGDSRGMACIPARCAPPRDGGTDAGTTDAGDDASATDAGASDAGDDGAVSSADAAASG